MTLTVEAIYENGVFKPSQPLPLREQEKVRLQVDTMEDAVQRVHATAGLIPCTNDQLIEWAATDAELDFPAPEES
ncbi:MAG TPA: antitoxin family protein [Gemmataceae bacterium]|jgi:predicted DNA-binding antitoxin AbrB/MazE fold protein